MSKKNLKQDEEIDTVVEIDEDGDDAYTDDDILFEGEDIGDGKIKKLQKELKKCKAERQEYLDGWQRVKADFVNAQKDFEKKRREYSLYATEKLIEDILPVIDSFDMAIANREVWERVDENWRVGVEYIYNQLISTLQANGVEQFNPIGETFDPTHHTSVEQVPAESEEQDHVITSVTQKGYRLKDKLLRSPKVTVAIWKQ